jgi:hypothetical protein
MKALQSFKTSGSMVIDHLTWHNTGLKSCGSDLWQYYLQEVRNGHPKNKAGGHDMIFPDMVNYVDKADKTGNKRRHQTIREHR